MDDFSNIINLLESAKQLASMNEMPMLAYLIDVAKCEAREQAGFAQAQTRQIDRQGRMLDAGSIKPAGPIFKTMS